MRRLFVKALSLTAAGFILLAGLLGCTLKPGEHSDNLTYKLPTVLTVPLGETIPGTDIRYEEHNEDGAYLILDGKRALKRKGDSVNWEGEPVPGASVNLNLRVVWFSEQSVHLAGTARVAVTGVTPTSEPPITTSPVKYSGAVAYSVAKGAYIPGTTLTYAGQDEKGASLGGLPEGQYPYRHAGDSVVWEGRLRDDVHIKLELRVIQYSERILRIGGLVTLWLGGT
ncbi:MAG: hypothetical protein ACP5G7_06470 [Anaerolineae bacterium]